MFENYARRAQNSVEMKFFLIVWLIWNSIQWNENCMTKNRNMESHLWIFKNLQPKLPILVEMQTANYSN